MYVSPDDTLYVVDHNVKKGVFIGSARDGSVRYQLDEAVAEGVAVDRDGNSMSARRCPGSRRSADSPAGISSGNSERQKPGGECLIDWTPRPESTTDRQGRLAQRLGDFRPKSRIMGLMILGVTAARLLK